MKKPVKEKKKLSPKMRAHIKRLQELNRKKAKAKKPAKVVRKAAKPKAKVTRKAKPAPAPAPAATSPEAVIAQAGGPVADANRSYGVELVVTGKTEPQPGTLPLGGEELL